MVQKTFVLLSVRLVKMAEGEVGRGRTMVGTSVSYYSSNAMKPFAWFG